MDQSMADRPGATALPRTSPLVSGLVYPECPRWRNDALYISDQHGGIVYRIAADGSRTVVLELPAEPGGLGWDPDGNLMVVAMRDRTLLRVRDGVTESVAQLGAFHPGLSNELLVDGVGRSYVGNIGFDFYHGEEPRTTCLVLVDVDGTVTVAADDLLVPNGMVLTAGGRRLVVAESFAHRLTGFAVAADGTLGERTVFADLGESVPDGICLDREGAIWFAAIGEHEVKRVLPGGEITDRISTGDAEAIACTLGGPDLTTLYVCTSGTFDPTRTVVERSGAIETATVRVPGAGSP